MDIDIATLTAELDGSDPLVIFLTWALTALVKKYAGKRYPKLRSILPVVAVLIAISLRGGAEAIQGQSFSLATVMHGLSAAGLAVLFHSQVREGKKLSEKRAEAVVAKAETEAEPKHIEEKPTPDGTHTLHRPGGTDDPA